MAPATVALDDPKTLERFKNSIKSTSRATSRTLSIKDTEAKSTVTAPASPLAGSAEGLEDGEVPVLPSPPPNVHGSQDDDVHAPSKLGEMQQAHEETQELAASPPQKGLLAPRNTPVTASLYPQEVVASRTSSNAPKPADVGDALYEYIQGMKGVPLSKSIWAPKLRSVSRDFPSVTAGASNPSTNDIPTRMSFKAASASLRPTMSHASTQTEDLDLATEQVSSKKAHADTSQLVKIRKEDQEPLSPKSSNETDQTPKLLTNEKREEIIKLRKDREEREDKVKRDRIRNKMNALDFPLTKAQLPFADTKEEAELLPMDARPASTIAIARDEATKDSYLLTNENLPLTLDLSTTYIAPHLRRKASKTNVEGTVVSQSGLQASQNGSMAVHGDPEVLPLKVKAMVLPSDFISKWTSKKAAKPTKPPIENLTGSKASTNPLISKESAVSIAMSGVLDGSDLTSRKSRKPADTKVSVPTSDLEPEEDRENQTWFSTWGVREERTGAPAQVRTVQLKSLPEGSTLAFVASLIFGGPLERLGVSSSGTTASVRFLHPADCKKFYDETSNGLLYGTDGVGKERVAWVYMNTDVDVVYGLLVGWIKLEFTRCVRAVGVDEECSHMYLWKIAEDKLRKLEGLERGRTTTGARFVTWRFADIKHAVQFYSSLKRNDEWEHCNITYTNDPCAIATEPRQKG